MLNTKGFLAALITAAVLAVPLYFYWEFLTRGMRPSNSTQILNEMEKTGAPNFTLKTMDGKEVSLKDYAGKVVLVNFWATWCAPCVKEFPSLKGLVEKFKGEVVVLAISYDRDREDIDTFVRVFGGLPKDFVILWDKEKSTSKLYGTDVLPETYIVSKTGKLLRKIAGEAIWDDELAIGYFQELMTK